VDVVGSDDHWLAVAHVIRHPLRQKLIFEYATAVTSPSAVAKTLGERLNLVSYHTNVLVAAGFLELVRIERRRGAHEHFYRATLPRSEIDDAGWERIPLKLRRSLVRLTVDTAWREARDALPRGGLDDADAHLSRSLVRLDAAGRREVATALRDTMRLVSDIERRSIERSADDAVYAELVMMCFKPA
jgi:hypothetical protein